jgi:hypothetical protein
MISILRTLALTACSFLCALGALSQTQDQSDKWKPLVESVQDVLAGKPIAEKGISISPGAYVVWGATADHLRRVAAGDSAAFSLTEDTSRFSASLTLKINDPEDAAYLLLKTQKHDNTEPRYHTVVFMKDSTARWVIQAWHTSN